MQIKWDGYDTTWKSKGPPHWPWCWAVAQNEFLIVNRRLQKDVLSNLPASTGASVKWAEGKWGGEASFQTRPALSPASVLLTTSLATPLPASDTQCTAWDTDEGGVLGREQGGVSGLGPTERLKEGIFVDNNRLIRISSFCFYLVFESTILVSFSP